MLRNFGCISVSWSKYWLFGVWWCGGNDLVNVIWENWVSLCFCWVIFINSKLRENFLWRFSNGYYWLIKCWEIIFV